MGKICPLKRGILLLICLLVLASNSNGFEDQENENQNEWVEPDAWSLSSYFSRGDVTNKEVCEKCDCPVVDNQAESIAITNSKLITIFYKKLIQFIFSREKLQVAASSADIYSRTLTFEIDEKHLGLLENAVDPRDWDSVLSKVLLNAYTPYEGSGKSDSLLLNLTDFFYDLFTGLSLSTEIRFTLILLLASLAIYYIVRKNHYGAMKTVVIVIMTMFLFGFIFTYYECNKQQELEELVNLLDEENPCDKMSENKSTGWWSSFFSGKPTKQDCIDHLKRKHKIKLSFCRPDDVFITYVNKVNFKFFGMFVEESTSILLTLVEKFRFPYNIIIIAVFGLSLPLFLKLMFKYIFAPAISQTNTSGDTSSIPVNRIENIGQITTGNDQISGENLKSLLDILKHHTLRHSFAPHQPQVETSFNPFQVSGVEILAEPRQQLKKFEKNFAIENLIDENDSGTGNTSTISTENTSLSSTQTLEAIETSDVKQESLLEDESRGRRSSSNSETFKLE